MANETIGAKIQLEFKTVGELRKALKESTGDLIRMRERFGETSKEAIAAAKRVAELRDRIQDAKEQADLFDPGKKFQAFTTAASQIAAGFTAVQGAMALVGSESEDLQKSLLKVQGALALTQGLSQLGDLGKAFEQLKIVGVNTFRAIRTAIGSTGIGLIVVAVGALVAYWDDIKEALTGVNAESKKNLDLAKANLKAQQEKLTTLDSQDNTLKLQGKSEREILQLKRAQVDQVILETEAIIEKEKINKELQVQAAKRNAQILDGILQILTAPTQLVVELLSKAAKLLGIDFDFDISKFVTKFVFDPEQVAADADAVIAEQEKTLVNLKNQRDGYILALREQDKKDREVKKQDKKSELDEELDFLRKQYDARIEWGQKQREAEERLAQERQKIREQEQKQLEDNFNKQVAYFDRIRQKAQEDLKVREEVERQKQQLILQTGNVLGILSDIVGRQTAAGKALGIAQATINTWIGATEVLRAKSILPEPAATISKIVNVAAVVASGINAIKNITRVQVPGGGIGGGVPSLNTTSPLQPALSPSAQLNVQNAEAINNLRNNAARAYILNSDLQNNNQINDFLKRNAQIG